MIDSRQDLHERALAGAVLAHEGMYFAKPDAKVNALKKSVRRENFCRSGVLPESADRLFQSLYLSALSLVIRDQGGDQRYRLQGLQQVLSVD
jgi:hypothetical protein